MHQYVSIKPLNAILPAGSITNVVTFFESTSSHSMVEDWQVELKVRSSEKIRQIARIFIDAQSAEILSISGIEVRQIKSEPEKPVVVAEEDEDEEEKPAKRGRKKKPVVEEIEPEVSEFEPLPLNFIDIPILEIVLNDRLYPLMQDEAFLALCLDEEVKQKLLKSIRLHEKNIIELGEPAPLPSASEEEDLEDSLTSVPSLSNDMMTANHQAYRAAQEEIRAKVMKRYEILNKRVQREEVTPIDERDVLALCEDNQIEYKSGDFLKDISKTIVGFDF